MSLDQAHEAPPFLNKGIICGTQAASSPSSRTVLVLDMVLEFFRKFWVGLCFASWKG